MKKFTARDFGLFVTNTTRVDAGTLLSTPFTLADGSVVTVLARAKRGRIELTDWGMTADFLARCNRRWEDVLERMAYREVVHGRVKIEGREIVSKVDNGDVQHHLGAVVQTILTLNNVVLLSHDPLLHPDE